MRLLGQVHEYAAGVHNKCPVRAPPSREDYPNFEVDFVLGVIHIATEIDVNSERTAMTRAVRKIAIIANLGVILSYIEKQEMKRNEEKGYHFSFFFLSPEK